MSLIKVGVLGAGTMGAGIAQVAAQSGHRVILVDVNEKAIETAKGKLSKIIERLIEKGKWTEDFGNDVFGRIKFSTRMEDFEGSGLIIEAIVENIEVKHAVFSKL